ncbi:uncharacterized protein A4U43_C03F22980 [Asparagus officinalis]|uniref:Uncharacterized protein n=1 Tax=Asparagus officinalis TaxID=4686 RepID=A0A5P1FCC0_ASPOF|nr:uncharacterized protein A4U43_C03F22980 [Asparagus officinalis]
MAKKKNKKSGVASMDISVDAPGDAPQAMDTSEGKPSKASARDVNRKIKKGVPMKRSKNLRKLKALAKAVAINEKSEEKALSSSA